MLATRTATSRFPGTVPALLAWADGDTERLGAMVIDFCREATALTRAVTRDVEARDAQGLRRAAHSLYARLAPFGAPRLQAAAALLEELAASNDLGPALAVAEELEANLVALCDYLAQKPWFRY